MSYTIQDYYWPRSLDFNYFEEPNIPPLKEGLHVEENIVLEEYVEVKEKNIEIFEEINEGLVIEEPKIKEEIIEEVVNDLDEVKLDDCNVQAPIILVGATKTKFIDFIGVERSNLIIDSYLVTIVNCMKIKGQEVQVAQLMTFKFGKKTRKVEYSKYLFSWHERFQISKMNSMTNLFQVKGSDVE